MNNFQIKETQIYSEENAINLENESVYDFSFETNKKEKTKSPNKTKRRTSLDIISKFVFLFAVVATIQVGIYIPVFSDIFNPQQNVAQQQVYITSVSTSKSFDTNYKYLKISIKLDPSFDDFNAIYFQLYDTETDTILPDYSLQQKEHVREPDIYGYPMIAISIETPPADYQLRLFCSTDSPEHFGHAESLVKDEITYYLFYTWEELISI